MAGRKFLHVTRTFTQHGKRRFRFRKNGVNCDLPLPWGSPEFVEAYEVALAAAMQRHHTPNAAGGTLAWLIERYLASPDYARLAPITKKNLRGEMDWLKANAGALDVAQIRVRHVEAAMGKKAGPIAEKPAAANKVKKLFSRLLSFAVRLELISVNHASRAKTYKTNEAGYHTWSDSEVEAFRARWPSGTLPRFALELSLNTGMARQDMAVATWSQVDGGRFKYTRGKTRQGTSLPILDDLLDEIHLQERRGLLMLTHGTGQSYKSESLGNWFKARCADAGIPHCNLHGLRKAGATRLAEAGATENEIAAFLAHSNTKQAATYTAAANRNKLTDSGLSKLSVVSNLRRSNVQPNTNLIIDKD